LKPNEEKIRSLGGKIFTGIHGLSGVERARMVHNQILPVNFMRLTGDRIKSGYPSR